MKDNPLGSVINNSAAIYFDYNAPVITNETWHTIGDHFITVTAVSNPKDANPVNVYPNPTAEMAWFELPAGETGGQFTLQNGLGVTVEAAQFAANRYQFQRKSLPSGQYFYQIKTDAGKVWTGKVVLR